MSRAFKITLSLIFFLAGGAAVWLFLNSMSDQAKAEGLGLSPLEYANGSKRAAAVARKVTPGLKAAFKEKDLTWGAPVFLRAFKEENILELWVKSADEKYLLFKSYPIAGASGSLGPKLCEGDRQVPEGFYFVAKRQLNPQSRFHLSFNIGYPNEFDKAHDRTGSFIMVHGSDVSIGCLAMTDTFIEEIYTLCDAALTNGQKFFRIHIFPFEMTEERLARASRDEWFDFWKNLEAGYRWFEDKKVPPDVAVKEKRYSFE
ncbi:L,D-transpeptidase family protein [Akkermansiaceae bacterium]|nr:L,D-transpeptidase family protein [Akkermansiaceae bacterium]MDA7888143.1 L,D-transpeptidase family protein [Akkermansiaceae bacterium]